MSVLPWMLACPRSFQIPLAGPAIIAQQRLDDRGRADHLHAGGVVRPAHCVASRAGALAPAVAGDRLRDFQEGFLRAARHALDHFGRVLGVVPPQDLEDAHGVLERRVARRRAGGQRRFFFADRCRWARRARSVAMAWACLGTAMFRMSRHWFLHPARKQAIQLAGAFVIVIDDCADVGVVQHILAEPQVVLRM